MRFQMIPSVIRIDDEFDIPEDSPVSFVCYLV